MDKQVKHGCLMCGKYGQLDAVRFDDGVRSRRSEDYFVCRNCGCMQNRFVESAISASKLIIYSQSKHQFYVVREGGQIKIPGGKQKRKESPMDTLLREVTFEEIPHVDFTQFKFDYVGRFLDYSNVGKMWMTTFIYVLLVPDDDLGLFTEVDDDECSCLWMNFDDFVANSFDYDVQPRHVTWFVSNYIQ